MSEQPEEQKDPMEFSTKVREWLDEVSEKAADFREQAGTPSLAIDAGLVNVLAQIGRIVDGERADLSAQLRASDERAAAEAQPAE